MTFSFASRWGAAAAAGLISAACGGNTPEAESPASDSGDASTVGGDEAGDAASDKSGCKGEEGCQHGGDCKGEEGCEGHSPE